jgi:transposase
MSRLLLTDDEWVLIEDLFGEPARTGRPPVERRKVLNGILWILRTGAPWRDLPQEFGAWQTAWRLFDQWNSDGTLDAVLHRLRASHAEVGAISGELWCVDGTVVRAARCSSGGGKKGIRRSRLITH